jgi:hypothetical protein
MTKKQMLVLSETIGRYLQSISTHGKPTMIFVGRYCFHLPESNRKDLWVWSGKKLVNRMQLR